MTTQRFRPATEILPATMMNPAPVVRFGSQVRIPGTDRTGRVSIVHTNAPAGPTVWVRFGADDTQSLLLSQLEVVAR